MEIEESSAFRVTRDADLEIDDQSDDLLQAMETELRRRRFGDVVRLELDASTSPEMRDQLIHHLGVTARHVYSVDGLLDLADLSELVAKDRPSCSGRHGPGSRRPRCSPQGGARSPTSSRSCAMATSSCTTRTSAFDTSVERVRPPGRR